MDIKKLKNKIIFILVVFVITLTACGPVSYKHSFTIRTSYREWVKQIGLFSHKNLKVYRYNEERYSINIDLVYENDLAGYKELCDVIAAHNKFVDENPDYFPSDVDIIINNMHASQETISHFYNKQVSSRFDYSTLGRANSAKIQYMSIDMKGDFIEFKKSDDITIDVPVIILNSFYEDYTPTGSKYEFLTEFKNAEQVVLDYWEPGYDKEEVCRSIREYLPDVEIYAVEDEHLVKCQ